MLPSFQTEFHRRWHRLSDPHVRDLAWLLDSPNVLDPDAPNWHGQIATLAFDSQGADAMAEWLHDIDSRPQELHAWLNLDSFARLGKYAEKLIAFYFRHAGVLQGHGIQVRDGNRGTIGEFDFLLRREGKLVHWEFATKFYLLQTMNGVYPKASCADYFVGPNLTDSLGAKMRKILDRQLSLSEHPAAQIHLPHAVDQAQALVKGWLFYREGDFLAEEASGLMRSHCRGFWRPLAEINDMPAGQSYLVLPRLSWLAPAKKSVAELKSRRELHEFLEQNFISSSMPVLVAVAEAYGEHAIEKQRGFIVPDDWCDKASERMRSEPIR